VSYPLKPPFTGVPAASLYVKLICGPANRSNLLSFFYLRLMTQCEMVGDWQIDRSG